MTGKQDTMTATGLAENAEPAPQRDKRFDGILKCAGIILAVFSAVLPFVTYYDVFDARSDPVASGMAIRDPLNRADQKVVRQSDMRQSERKHARPAEIDPMTTATTGAPDDRVVTEANAEQSFPAKPNFQVREVVGGLVMIEDASGYWFVEKGSPLPDGSRLVAIQRGETPGSWNIRTSDGNVITRVN